MVATDAEAHLKVTGGWPMPLKVLPHGGRFYDAAFVVRGDGSDETAAFQAACSAAASAGLKLIMTGLEVIVSSITLTKKLRIAGSDSITKLAGSSGGLLYATGVSLTIRGNITIDQNKANTLDGGGLVYQDNYAIRCDGGGLILEGVTLPASRGPNIYASTTEKLLIKDCDISGGYMCVYGSVGVNCNVAILGGKFSASTGVDNIQVLNAKSVLIDGVESFDSARSGIVASNAAENVRIVNNNCHGNKIDGTDQGGWGIVASVDVAHFVIANNTCGGNERGGISADTYSERNPPHTDAYYSISNNTIDGEGPINPSGYCATGISINGAQRGVVSGNYIRRANQGIHSEDALRVTISGNTIEDIGPNATYFVQTLRGTDVLIANNLCTGAGASTGTGVVGIIESSRVSLTGNKLENIAGSRPLIRITNSPETSIKGNTLHKSDAGSAYLLWLANDCSRAVIEGNDFLCTAAAFQYYIYANGATVTGAITRGNNIVCSGIQTNPNRYIYNGSAMNAESDNINGLINYYSAAPTMFTPLTGAVASIAGVLKHYNGSTWV